MAYFEAKIVKRGLTAKKMILGMGDEGLTEDSASGVRLPDQSSFGMDSNGRIHGLGNSNEIYAPKWQVGDVIGVGYDLDALEVFFTLNGRPRFRCFSPFLHLFVAYLLFDFRRLLLCRSSFGSCHTGFVQADQAIQPVRRCCAQLPW